MLESQHWYEGRRRGLGAEFEEGVAETVSRVAENPSAFQKVRGETRRAVLRRFPYAIYFRLTGDRSSFWLCTVVNIRSTGSLEADQNPPSWSIRSNHDLQRTPARAALPAPLKSDVMRDYYERRSVCPLLPRRETNVLQQEDACWRFDSGSIR